MSAESHHPLALPTKRQPRLGVALLLLATLSSSACRSPEDVAGKLTLAWSDGKAALRTWPPIDVAAVAKYRASVQLADNTAGSPPAWEGSSDARWLAVGRMRDALHKLDVVIAEAEGSPEPAERDTMASMGRYCETQWADARAAYDAAR